MPGRCRPRLQALIHVACGGGKPLASFWSSSTPALPPGLRSHSTGRGRWGSRVDPRSLITKDPSPCGLLPSARVEMQGIRRVNYDDPPGASYVEVVPVVTVEKLRLGGWQSSHTDGWWGHLGRCSGSPCHQAVLRYLPCLAVPALSSRGRRAPPAS